jgi:hypothetical protein
MLKGLEMMLSIEVCSTSELYCKLHCLIAAEQWYHRCSIYQAVTHFSVVIGYTLSVIYLLAKAEAMT